MRPWPAGRWRATAACALEVIVGEEVTTLGGHLLALFIERPIRPYRSLRTTIAAVHDAGGLAIPAHPLVPYPLCAQGWVLRRLLEDADPAFHPDALETFNPTAPGGRGTAGSCRFAASHGLAASATATPTPRRDRHRLDDVRGPHGGGPAARRSRPAHPTRRRVPRARPARSAMFGRQLRKTGRDARDEVARARPARRHRPRPRLSRRPRRGRRATTARTQRTSGPMKIGLVCPYIYPVPGGVTQHVRYLYENLRLRGHDVRIITRSHGPQRSSEGDIIRLGRRVLACPTNGSVGTLTVSPRYLSPDRRRCSSASGSTCSISTSRSCRSCRSSCCASRTSVNVATFHAYAGFSPSYEFGSRALGGHAARLHGRIAVSAAARHFIDRFFPGDYKVIPNGVDVGRFANAVPIARWQDGTPNILFVGRFEPRKGLIDLLKAHRILRKTGCELPAARGRLRPAGARGAALRRDARPAGCRVPRPRVGRREGAALPDRRRLRLPGDRRRIVRHRAARGDGRRHARSCARDIHGYKGVVRRGREGLLVPPREPRELAIALDRLLRDPALREQMGAAGQERAEQFSWPRVTAKVEDYYGFVIRRLAAAGNLPAGFTADVPQAPPPVRARPSAASPEPLAGVALAARRLRDGQPPDRGRVGDHEAGHGDGDRQDRQGRRQQRRREAAFRRADRELERVQVGRQQALVGVGDGRRQRQRRDVRVGDGEPATAATISPPT